ncbi:MAG: hypothetical protein NTW86_30740 [Candidatus Sumerlaeota bacterium]|nr:hypothetical protein [Candidatus Sumerlaeota bacterium]
MNWRGAVGLLAIVASIRGAALAENGRRDEQYILINVNPSVATKEETFAEIRGALPCAESARRRVGIGAIFLYLNQPREKTAENLRRFLRLAQDTDTPVVVQLDGENWLGGRPDLWNWWDPAKPGYDPANASNVEWTGWGPQYAVKIGWRNWGRQLRVLPAPNLMSLRYREACHAEQEALAPIILEWWRSLPESKRDLFVGIKVGWESSIGVSAWHYPNGNELLDRPESEDPKYGLDHDKIPSRGVATLGYAAAFTSGLRREGELTEADQVGIVRRHLADLCHQLAALGVPRDKLFTHVAGWKEGELLYQAGLNPDSCPGWSFYRHADDPRTDVGVQEALKKSDAPYWAAVEWLFQKSRQTEPWRHALEATLADPRCRYLNIYNWDKIRDSDTILEAIRQTVAARADQKAP